MVVSKAIDRTIKVYSGSELVAALARLKAQSAPARTVIKVEVPEVTVSEKLVLTKQIRIEGYGGSVDSADNRTVIYQSTDNTPIVEIGADGFSGLGGVCLEYTNAQSAANTSAACLHMLTGAYRGNYHDVGLVKGAYGIRQADAAACWQNNFQSIYVREFSIGGIDLGADNSGTVSSFSDIYVQQILEDRADSIRSITGVSRVGNRITFTVSAVPSQLKVNRFCRVKGMDATYNGSFVVVSISGLDIVVDAASDPGDPVITSGGTLQIDAGYCTGFPVRTNRGLTTWSGLQIEHVVTARSSIMYCQGQYTKISDVAFEQCYSDNAITAYIHATNGGAEIGSVAVYNSGILPGNTGYIARTIAATAEVNIQGVSMRDMAYTGATLLLGGRSDDAYPQPTVGQVKKIATVRANATSEVSGLGVALSPIGSAKKLTGASGTEKGLAHSVEVNQSSTAGYVGYEFDIVPTATGSGSKKWFSVLYNGLTRFLIDPSGWFFNSQGAIGRTVFYDGSSVTPSVLIQVGDTGLDKRLKIYGGETIQATNNAESSQLILSLNKQGGVVVIGSGAASSGVRIGPSGTTFRQMLAGTATLSGGTVSVANTAVTTASIAVATHKVVAGTQGMLRVQVTDGVGITITSSSGTDTSTVNYWIGII